MQMWAKSQSLEALKRGRAWLIERFLEPITLSEAAEAAGLSAYHFSRQFSARYGAGPMAYVRALRLAHAAQRLREGPAPNLAQLALECGFESQEGFTRAFARTYGAPPGRYARGRSTMETTPMSESPIRDVRLVGPVGPEQRPAIRACGVTRDFSEADKHEIPMLWDTLFAHPGATALSGGRTFGVCCASQVEGCELRYSAAIELQPGVDPPPGLDAVDLSERRYLVFRMTTDGSDLHQQMQAAAREIWGVRVPAGGFTLARAPDLEVYPPGFAPDAAGAVLEWWLPVEA